MGGFESAETILEPVAAALAYSATKQVGKETVLVFDLEVALDCCVVELDGNRAELIALGGDAKLGETTLMLLLLNIWPTGSTTRTVCPSKRRRLGYGY